MEPSMILAVMGVLGFAIIGYMIMDSGGSSPSKRVGQFSTSQNKERKSAFSFMKSDETSNRRKMIENSLADLRKSAKIQKEKEKNSQSKAYPREFRNRR